MILQKCGVIMISIAVLLITGTHVAGEQIIKTDDTGDIVYLFSSDGQLTWQNYSGEKPNIDITSISKLMELLNSLLIPLTICILSLEMQAI